jgi:ATP-binding cassette subfamily B (MDR/TAP) protein 1
MPLLLAATSHFGKSHWQNSIRKHNVRIISLCLTTLASMLSCLLFSDNPEIFLNKRYFRCSQDCIVFLKAYTDSLIIQNTRELEALWRRKFSARSATQLHSVHRTDWQKSTIVTFIKQKPGGFRMRATVGIMIGCVMAIIFCNYGLPFWQGSRFLVAGEISVGHIITILLATIMGSVQLGQVAPHLQAIGVAVSTAGPIFSVIDRPYLETSGGKITLDSLEGRIELQKVKHVYPSRSDVLVMHDFDLVVPAGKVTALVRASGSGKSTIVGLIERFYTPISGRILLDGEDIQTMDLKWPRRQMTLVSQEPVLFGTSIYANIADGLIGTQCRSAP